MTKMLVATTEGLRAGRGCYLTSTNAKEVAEFLSKNSLTAGFSVQFVRMADNRIIEVFRKGKVTQRVVKALVELGAVEWFYSYAWSPKNFQLASGEVVQLSGTLDLVKDSDVRQWAQGG